MSKSDKTDILKEKMLEALTKSLNIVSSACKSVGVSRDTHYRWLKEDEDYRLKCEDIDNIALDFAESKLHNQINDNNTTATIFYLKTKGKKRGYVERQEIDNGLENDFRVEIVYGDTTE
jgi:hypothetical protein